MAQWPKDTYFLIKNQSFNKVIAVADGSTKPGADIVIEEQRKDASEIDRQLWSLKDGQLVNKLSGLAIATAGGSLKTGTKIVLSASSSDVPTFSLTDVYQLQLQLPSLKTAVVLGVNTGLFSRKEGAQVVIQEKKKVDGWNDRKDQRWEFIGYKVKTVAAPAPAQTSPAAPSDASILATPAGATKKISTSVKTIPVVYPRTGLFGFPATTDLVSSLGAENESSASSITGFMLLSLSQKLISTSPLALIAPLSPKNYRAQSFVVKDDGSLFCQESNTYLIVSGTPAVGAQVVLGSEPTTQWEMRGADAVAVNGQNNLVIRIVGDAQLELAEFVEAIEGTEGWKDQRWVVSAPLVKRIETIIPGSAPPTPAISVASAATKVTTVVAADGVSTTHASFPNGWFIITFPAFGDDQVLTATSEDKILISTLVSGAVTAAYAFQLWTYSEGYLINRAKGTSLDVKSRSIGDNYGLTLSSPRTFRASEAQSFLLQIDPAVAGKYRIAVTADESFLVASGVERESAGVVGAIAGGIGSVLGVGKKKEEKRVGVLEKVGSKGFDLASARVAFKVLVLEGVEEKVVRVESQAAGQIQVSEVTRYKKLRADAKSWSSWISSFYGDEIPQVRLARFPDGEFFIGFKAWGREYVVGTTSDGAFHTVEPGASIELQPLDRKNYRAQLWRFRRDGKLENVESGLVMDIKNNKLAHGTQLIQWHAKDPNVDSANQTFVLGSDRSIMLAEDVNLILGLASPLPTFAASEVIAGLPIALYRRDSVAEARRAVEFLYPVFKDGEVCGWEEKEGFVVDETAVVIKFGESSSTKTTKIVVDEKTGFSAVSANVAESDPESGAEFSTTVSTSTKSYLIESDVRRRYASFPSGVFLIYFVLHGKELVLNVGEDNAVSLKKIEAARIRYQLWEYVDGFLVNVATGLVLDLEGSSVEAGGKLKVSKRKARVASATAQFGLYLNGRIFFVASESIIVSAAIKDALFSSTISGAEAEQIGLLIPTFKTKTVTKCSASGSTTEVSEIDYESYSGCEESTLTVLSASWEELESVSSSSSSSSNSWLTGAYGLATRRKEVALAGLPSGEFAIYLPGISSGEKKFTVLTVDGAKVIATALSFQDAGKQLWRYVDGSRIVNLATGHALAVDSATSGVVVVASVEAGAKWGVTVDGELVVREHPSFVVSADEKGQVAVRVRDTVDASRSKIVVLFVTFAAGAGVGGSAWTIEGTQEVTYLEQSETLTEDVRSTVTVLTRYNVVSTQKKAQFPSEWCLIYCNKHGKDYVLDVNPDDGETIELRQFNPKARDSQMWKWDEGVWINQKYGMVLVPAIQGGAGLRLAASGSRSNEEKWRIGRSSGICLDGAALKLYIGADAPADGVGKVILGTTSQLDERFSWGFRILTIKKVMRTSVVASPAQKIVRTIIHKRILRVARLPTEWFFIYVTGYTQGSVYYVLGASGNSVSISQINLSDADAQLWTYEDGKLVNKATGLYLTFTGAGAGSSLSLEAIRGDLSQQLFYYGSDGTFFLRSSPQFVVETVASYTIVETEVAIVQEGEGASGYVVKQASELSAEYETSTTVVEGAYSGSTEETVSVVGTPAQEDRRDIVESASHRITEVVSVIQPTYSSDVTETIVQEATQDVVESASHRITEVVSVVQPTYSADVVETVETAQHVQQTVEIVLPAPETEEQVFETVVQATPVVSTKDIEPVEKDVVAAPVVAYSSEEPTAPEGESGAYPTEVPAPAEPIATYPTDDEPTPEGAHGEAPSEPAVDEKLEPVVTKEYTAVVTTEQVFDKEPVVEPTVVSTVEIAEHVVEQEAVVETTTEYVTVVEKEPVAEITAEYVETSEKVVEEALVESTTEYVETTEKVVVEPVAESTTEYISTVDTVVEPAEVVIEQQTVETTVAETIVESTLVEEVVEAAAVSEKVETVVETAEEIVVEQPTVATVIETTSETTAAVEEVVETTVESEVVEETTQAVVETTEETVIEKETAETTVEATSAETVIVQEESVDYTVVTSGETIVESVEQSEVVESTVVTAEETIVQKEPEAEYIPAAPVDSTPEDEASAPEGGYGDVPVVTEVSDVAQTVVETTTEESTIVETTEQVVMEPVVETTTEYVTTVETVEHVVVEKEPLVESSTEYVTTVETSEVVVENAPSVEGATEYVSTVEAVVEKAEEIVVEQQVVETAVKSSTDTVSTVETVEQVVEKEPVVESSTEYITAVETSEVIVEPPPVVEETTEYVATVETVVDKAEVVVEHQIVETTETETVVQQSEVVTESTAVTTEETVVQREPDVEYVLAAPVDSTPEDEPAAPDGGYGDVPAVEEVPVVEQVVETITEESTTVETTEHVVVEQAVETASEYVSTVETVEQVLVEKEPVVESSTEYVTIVETSEVVVEKEPIVEAVIETVVEKAEDVVIEQQAVETTVETSTESVVEYSTVETVEHVVEKEPVVESSTEYVTTVESSEVIVEQPPVVEETTEYVSTVETVVEKADEVVVEEQAGETAVEASTETVVEYSTVETVEQVVEKESVVESSTEYITTVENSEVVVEQQPVVQETSEYLSAVETVVKKAEEVVVENLIETTETETVVEQSETVVEQSEVVTESTVVITEETVVQREPGVDYVPAAPVDSAPEDEPAAPEGGYGDVPAVEEVPVVEQVVETITEESTTVETTEQVVVEPVVETTTEYVTTVETVEHVVAEKEPVVESSTEYVTTVETSEVLVEEEPVVKATVESTVENVRDFVVEQQTVEPIVETSTEAVVEYSTVETVEQVVEKELVESSTEYITTVETSEMVVEQQPVIEQTTEYVSTVETVVDKAEEVVVEPLTVETTETATVVEESEVVTEYTVVTSEEASVQREPDVDYVPAAPVDLTPEDEPAAPDGGYGDVPAVEEVPVVEQVVETITEESTTVETTEQVVVEPVVETTTEYVTTVETVEHVVMEKEPVVESSTEYVTAVETSEVVLEEEPVVKAIVEATVENVQDAVVEQPIFETSTEAVVEYSTVETAEQVVQKEPVESSTEYITTVESSEVVVEQQPVIEQTTEYVSTVETVVEKAEEVLTVETTETATVVEESEVVTESTVITTEGTVVQREPDVEYVPAAPVDSTPEDEPAAPDGGYGDVPAVEEVPVVEEIVETITEESTTVETTEQVVVEPVVETTTEYVTTVETVEHVVMEKEPVVESSTEYVTAVETSEVVLEEEPVVKAIVEATVENVQDAVVEQPIFETSTEAVVEYSTVETAEQVVQKEPVESSTEYITTVESSEVVVEQQPVIEQTTEYVSTVETVVEKAEEVLTVETTETATVVEESEVVTESTVITTEGTVVQREPDVEYVPAAPVDSTPEDEPAAPDGGYGDVPAVEEVPVVEEIVETITEESTTVDATEQIVVEPVVETTTEYVTTVESVEHAVVEKEPVVESSTEYVTTVETSEVVVEKAHIVDATTEYVATIETVVEKTEEVVVEQQVVETTVETSTDSIVEYSTVETVEQVVEKEPVVESSTEYITTVETSVVVVEQQPVAGETVVEKTEEVVVEQQVVETTVETSTDSIVEYSTVETVEQVVEKEPVVESSTEYITTVETSEVVVEQQPVAGETVVEKTEEVVVEQQVVETTVETSTDSIVEYSTVETVEQVVEKEPVVESSTEYITTVETSEVVVEQQPVVGETTEYLSTVATVVEKAEVVVEQDAASTETIVEHTGVETVEQVVEKESSTEYVTTVETSEVVVEKEAVVEEAAEQVSTVETVKGSTETAIDYSTVETTVTAVEQVAEVAEKEPAADYFPAAPVEDVPADEPAPPDGRYGGEQPVVEAPVEVTVDEFNVTSEIASSEYVVNAETTERIVEVVEPSVVEKSTEFVSTVEAVVEKVEEAVEQRVVETTVETSVETVESGVEYFTVETVAPVVDKEAVTTETAETVEQNIVEETSVSVEQVVHEEAEAPIENVSTVETVVETTLETTASETYVENTSESVVVSESAVEYTAVETAVAEKEREIEYAPAAPVAASSEVEPAAPGEGYDVVESTPQTVDVATIETTVVQVVEETAAVTEYASKAETIVEEVVVEESAVESAVNEKEELQSSTENVSTVGTVVEITEVAIEEQQSTSTTVETISETFVQHAEVAETVESSVVTETVVESTAVETEVAVETAVEQVSETVAEETIVEHVVETTTEAAVQEVVETITTETAVKRVVETVDVESVRTTTETALEEVAETTTTELAVDQVVETSVTETVVEDTVAAAVTEREEEADYTPAAPVEDTPAEEPAAPDGGYGEVQPDLGALSEYVAETEVVSIAQTTVEVPKAVETTEQVVEKESLVETTTEYVAAVETVDQVVTRESAETTTEYAAAVEEVVSKELALETTEYVTTIESTEQVIVEGESVVETSVEHVSTVEVTGETTEVVEQVGETAESTQVVEQVVETAVEASTEEKSSAVQTVVSESVVEYTTVETTTEVETQETSTTLVEEKAEEYTPAAPVDATAEDEPTPRAGGYGDVQPTVEETTEQVTTVEYTTVEQAVVETVDQSNVESLEQVVEREVVETTTEYATTVETTEQVVIEKESAETYVSTGESVIEQAVESVTEVKEVVESEAKAYAGETEREVEEPVVVVSDTVKVQEQVEVDESSYEVVSEESVVQTETSVEDHYVSLGMNEQQIVSVTTIVDSLIERKGLSEIKAFVFDVLSVVNWRKKLAADLAKAAEPHNVANVDWDAVAIEWYSLFVKRTSETNSQEVGADAVLRATLEEVAATHKIECWSGDELDVLVKVWQTMDLHDDAANAVKSIKESYVAATYSDVSLHTLIQLARHCKMCWNAQISTEISGSARASGSYGSVSKLIGYKPSEILYVGGDYESVKAANLAGFATAFVTRSAVTEDTSKFDIVVDGLNGLQAVVSGYRKKEEDAKKKPRGWFQRLADAATDIGKAVARVAHEE
ncbi:hypothetical protein BJ742DRAFT_33426 [Cladochytrium replicatum]|nr:hypothetical protein BJ742DRAFT_33426 [Cladochytrium replicatum]